MATRLCTTIPSSFAAFPTVVCLRHLRLPAVAGRGAAVAAAAAAPCRLAPPPWRAAPLGGRPPPPFSRVSTPARPPAGRVRMLAAPRKALPKHTVRVYCAGCRSLLYKYHKGGTGSLVKVYLERIAVDETAAPGVCGGCGVTVARPATIHGRPALKMVGGKVYVRG